MENAVRRELENRLSAGFGLESEAYISVPGRTELIGNHTDHQRGCVVAAAVTLSLDAAAARTGDGRIRVLSEGMEPVDVALDSLDAVSYTHLDVYKRQARIRPPCSPRCAISRAASRPAVCTGSP